MKPEPDPRRPKEPKDRAAARASRRESSAVARGKAWHDTALLYLSVAAGSVIGGSLRYAAALVALQPFGLGAPWATLFVNVTGSLAIGFYAALTGPDGRLIAGPRRRHFVMTGVCGGYTTFSAFGLETFRMIQAGDPAAAGLTVAATLVGSLAAVWLGYALAARLNRLRR
jgi:CrcB protein